MPLNSLPVHAFAEKYSMAKQDEVKKMGKAWKYGRAINQAGMTYLVPKIRDLIAKRKST